MTASVVSTVGAEVSVPVNTLTNWALPPGLQIGDVLRVVFSASKASMPEPPAGWTKVPIQHSNAAPCRCWERVIDGTEGAELNFIFHLYQSSLVSYIFAIIRDVDVGVPTEFNYVQQSGGTLAPNPRDIIPSWYGDTLFMVLLAWRWARGTRPVVTGFPTDFDNGQAQQSYDDDYGTGIAIAFHNASGSVDAGAFMLDINSATACYTIASKSF